MTVAAVAPASRRARLLGWVRLVHAFPVATVTLSTAGVAWGSAGDEATGARVALVTLAMLFGQCSIGIQNDYLDRFRDAAVKTAKPIPAGLVRPQHARVAWVACLGVFVALNVPLGLQAMAIGIVALSAGFAYNLTLKFSPVGFLAYVAGFSFLGLWVWVATAAVRPEVLWALVFAPPLLAGLGISNSIPDVLADARTGVATFAVAVGRGSAAVVTWGLFAFGWVLMLCGALVVEVRLATILAPAAVAAVAGTVGLVATATHHDWLAFRLYGVGTAVALVGWLSAVD